MGPFPVRLPGTCHAALHQIYGGLYISPWAFESRIDFQRSRLAIYYKFGSICNRQELSPTKDGRITVPANRSALTFTTQYVCAVFNKHEIMLAAQIPNRAHTLRKTEVMHQKDGFRI